MDTSKKKKEFLKAYEAKANNISLACKGVGIVRQTYYNWMENDPEFAQEIENLNEAELDFAETQLKRLMRDGDKISTIFYLKTKGKKRGYVERTELTGAEDAEPIRIEIVD